MANKVVMAQLSPTMEEGRLVEWKVEEGDEVLQGDVVAEIETDKANMDVEAMAGGVLRKIVVGEGQTVPVGATIGIIADEDEDIEDLLEEARSEGAGGEPAAAEEAGEAEEPEEGAEPAEEEAGEPEEAPDETGEPAAASRPAAGREGGDGDRVKASPLARRMADDEGLSLSQLEGSGPSGRIVKADIERAVEERAARPAAAAAGPARLEEERMELTQMRKAIAKRLTQSLGPVPHFFLTVEIDMERALALRAELNDRLESGKVGVNDLLVKAAAEALVRHPEVNASWDDGAIQRHGSADIGIAVALMDDEQGGLITPIVREADRKGLLQISAEAAELVERARSRDLEPEEFQGATFSISNLGMFGIDEFTAIINPPESAILAVGGTKEKPVAVDGQVEVRKRMRVTMSCDHRVVDGAMGARFLDTFRGMLENPLEMLL